jgi:CDP-diacylglycerol--glycerol-3-phosphate 3-phosphatidyltransferase
VTSGAEQGGGSGGKAVFGSSGLRAVSGMRAQSAAGAGRAGASGAGGGAASDAGGGRGAASDAGGGRGAAPGAGSGLARVSSPGLVNTANALTVTRLALVPVFAACLVAGGPAGRYAALAAFVTASVTDLLDGLIARSRGLVTDFGKIADPVADKALTGAALVTLSALGELAWWVTALVLAREIGVTGLRFWVLRHGVIAASRGGKLKTAVQAVAIMLYVLPLPLGAARPVVMAVAVVVTLITGADYVVRAARLRRRAPGPPGT